MGNISNVSDIIRVHGVDLADKVAIVQDDRRVTWVQLHARSCQVANMLADNGVGSGDRVAFLDKNGIEHFEVFYGASLLNAVCVDVNWRLAAPEVEYVVNDSLAKVLVVGVDFLPILDAIASGLTSVTKILVIDGHDHAYADYGAEVAASPTTDPGATQGDDDVAFQLYSSGTTGRPKGVLLTNANFFGLLPLAKEMWELDADSVNLVAMPLFHIGGGGWATAGQYMGATSVILRELDPNALIRLIGEEQITHAFLVPVVLQFMLMMPDIGEADFSSLKVCVYGASPISEDVLARSVQTFGCKFWQAYGLTETTGAVVNLAPADHDLSGPHRHRLRSCGLPGPGVEIRIVDNDEGGYCEQGEVGEIWIRSPQVMKGYWNLPDDTAKSITADGWFKSGDAGYLDVDGYLYIHDRVKDMIVSGGENVYPAEVENVLHGHPGIADVAVIGVPDEKWGETAKAIVVRQSGSEVTEQEIIDYARERLARFTCPTTVELVDSLPRNPSGKILKKDLRAPYWEGRDRNVN
jgi:long-chain acyl-CoA synthetase